MVRVSGVSKMARLGRICETHSLSYRRNYQYENNNISFALITKCFSNVGVLLMLDNTSDMKDFLVEA